MRKLIMQSHEYTFPASGEIIRTQQTPNFQNDFPLIVFPAKRIMASGDNAFSIEINAVSTQTIKLYNSPYRTPIIEIGVSGFTLKGTNTKKVTVNIWGYHFKEVKTK